jgi:hypothetical protein
MTFMRRSLSVVAVLATAAILTSCSPDGSGTLNGPSSNLDRKEGITRGPNTIATCTFSARNVFMDNASLPFTADCEDMNEAVHSVLAEEYDANGCMTTVRGHVMFPSNGHTYSYVASRDGCHTSGGTMLICGSTLEKCQTYALPVATAIDVRRVREASQ